MSPGSSSSRWSTRHGRSRRRRASSASRTWPFSTVTLPSAPRTSPQITRPSRAVTAAPSRASATGFIYLALTFGSATFRLEHLFSPRLTVPLPAARPRFGSNIYSALASPCPPLRLGHVSARTSIHPSPHRALPFGSATVRLEPPFSPRLPLPLP